MTTRKQKRRQLKKKVLTSFRWGSLGLIVWCIALSTMISSTIGVSSVHAEPVKKMVIIIDDLGNGMKGTDEMLNMPTTINVAIMPFLPTTKRDAELAHQKGIDVLVHMPMEPRKGRKDWLGPGAITTDLSDEEIRKRVNAAIDEVPYAIAMNNHMGSKVTSDRRIMSIVLDVCKERGLFFVDSKTDQHSVVAELAAEKGMPPVENDIFLDDQYSISHISRQMRLAEEKLKQQDICVTIGHVGVPGLMTAGIIRDALPRLTGKVELISISDMVKQVWNWNPDPTIPTNNK
ncbi:divergent polysaccharide deacetylase family protein [Paenibacillus gallinarum]|uniref:Divergent polysaccharide deacetylase family protein n=1 Tax=Paenibacillus gallinarum TaxID=2762232 RepID=A0ABR8SUM9_9BACL|nr:divergent polysaccharide deacetylase family protein [Paenibacillus gallinarum]MBD7967095.1 divergent polysaccharide deacetylase family protein [Paenibacillus gallinarum]